MNNRQNARSHSPFQRALNRSRTHTLACALALVGVAPAAQALELTDLAGVSATASRCYLGCGNARYDASNVLDGDYGATGNTGLNAWNAGTYSGYVQIDLTAVFELDRIELYGVYPYFNPFTLSVSADGQSWSTVAVGGYALAPGLPEAGVGGVRYGAIFDVANGSLASGINARHVRYTLNGGSPQWAYLAEIDVQGHVPTVPEPDALALMLTGLGLISVAARRRSR